MTIRGRVFGVATTLVLATAIGRGTSARAARATDDAPQGITVLYQNFPNPFPSATSPTTCLWFDLSEASEVTLAVYDLRGHLVRTIVPSPTVTGNLGAGQYGRLSSGPNGGCDMRFSWDGRGSDGHTLPAGLYLARLHANGHWQTKKMVFRGQ